MLKAAVRCPWKYKMNNIILSDVTEPLKEGVINDRFLMGKEGNTSVYGIHYD